MALIITDDTLSKAQLSADELLVDLACYLYDKKRMSMGQAVWLDWTKSASKKN